MNACLFAFTEGCEFSSAFTAAWVQGLGSLAAVGAAILIARQSSLQTRDTQKWEVIRGVELVCSICWQVHHFTMEVLRTEKDADEVPLPKNLERIIDLLDRFPVDRYPSGEMALRSASIRRIAESFLEAQVDWQNYRAGKPADGRGLDIIRDLTSEISAEYEGLVRCGQHLLYAQPGKRVFIPAEFSDQTTNDLTADRR
ncbi:MAG: hypothetical protein Q7S93_06540 [Phenylobacterium sp.]|uniref:hypothetical protein n=1 Tax=Phenylobacterium sp. TaxID=1871053 RepID=UPI002718942A|nr:hypothetical protein [Phenylobacterium sp.]MDO8409702.1 hypothetical protein [Phenylobacterium sp.]